MASGEGTAKRSYYESGSDHEEIYPNFFVLEVHLIKLSPFVIEKKNISLIITPKSVKNGTIKTEVVTKKKFLNILLKLGENSIV